MNSDKGEKVRGGVQTVFLKQNSVQKFNFPTKVVDANSLCIYFFC